MDPDEAIRALGRWRVRLRLFVEGHGPGLDAAEIERDDACALGSWIHGEARRELDGRALAEIETAHAALHRAAAEAVRAAGEGDRERARGLLGPGGAFDRASNATMLALVKRLRDLMPV